MSEEHGLYDMVDRRKMVRAVLQHAERFTWSEAEGRLVPDRRGDIVFINDVVKIIEGRKG